MELWSETRRKVLVEGVSKREICRDYKLGWRTLEKILEHPEPPGYRSRVPRALPKLGPFVGLIDEMLESDRDAPPRQRPTARRIFHRLRDEHDYRAARFWSEAELGADRFPAVAGLPIDETFGGDR